MKKFILMVMDSVGIGALPDAANFGDEGSDTLGHLFETVPGLTLPNLSALGLGNIQDTAVPHPASAPIGCFGKAAERFLGKDTTGGHWEMAGLVLDKPFQVFPHGFPQAFIEQFEQRIGRKTLCNRPASGTEIIAQLGDEHVRTGCPIVYTSADSVFQIAMHEAVIPLDEQYRICAIAREMLTGDLLVGRVIARPFTGTSGQYVRTPHRKDFSVEPVGETILDVLKGEGYEVAGVGKIEDIFAYRGLTKSDHRTDNMSSVDATLEFIRQPFEGLVFTNLVDFDSLYGHRNDPRGYAQALMDLDARLPDLMQALGEEDILCITADHGCDPTTPSTDHSREYVPILCYGKMLRQGIDLGIRQSFSDISATIAQFFTVRPLCGQSFLDQLKGEQ